MRYGMRYASPVGWLNVVTTEDAVTELRMERQKSEETVWKEGQTPLLNAVSEWLNAYFEGKAPSAKDLPLKPSGSAFQKRVWELLCEIPYGKTTTYGALAKIIASERGIVRMSAQAVGGAVGRNPIGIIIPCHRVIGADGSLIGYAGGLDVKRRLLELEGAL